MIETLGYIADVAPTVVMVLFGICIVCAAAMWIIVRGGAD